jgi:hypothetical protein
MSDPIALVREFLEEGGVDATNVDGEPAFRAMIAGENGMVPTIVGLLIERQQLLVYTHCTALVPPEHRAAIAEMVCRANYGLPLGAFELGFDDGVLRFRCSVDYEDVGLSKPMIRNVLGPAVYTMDRYLPGFLGVLFGGKTASDAIAEIER